MSDGGMTAEDVRSMTFEMPPRGRPGHDEKSVDDFLALALLDKIGAAMAKTR
jgi:DivIVA domain-containing protein